MIISVWKKWMYIGHPKKVYDFSLQQLLYILRMVQNCQSIINQLALAIGQAKLRRELLLFKNHPNVPIMSKKITNLCIFQLLKLNQEERSLLRSHSWRLMDDVIVIICHVIWILQMCYFTCNSTLVLFKGFLLKRLLTIPLLKGLQMGTFKKASSEFF